MGKVFSSFAQLQMASLGLDLVLQMLESPVYSMLLWFLTRVAKLSTQLNIFAFWFIFVDWVVGGNPCGATATAVPTATKSKLGPIKFQISKLCAHKWTKCKEQDKTGNPPPKNVKCKRHSMAICILLSRWNLTMFAFSFLRALICINSNQGTTYCINNYQGTRYWGALMFIWHWSLGCFIHILWIYKELLTNTLYFTSRNQMSAGLRFRSSIQNTYSYHRFRASDKHILQKSFLVFLWFSMSLEHIFVIILWSSP